MPGAVRLGAQLLLVASACAQGYGPDPSGVPADFLCAWRQLALEYASALRPDSAVLVYDALAISDFCNDTVRPLEAASPPQTFVTTDAIDIFVSTSGDDANAGTKELPLRTIQAGVDAARAAAAASPSPVGATVSIRAGTFYVSTAISLSAADSNLTLQNYDGEEVWVSGGVPLEGISWEPHNVSNDTTTYEVLTSQNNAHGCNASNPSDATCGCAITDDLLACEAACTADSQCRGFTWHDADQGATWALHCCVRRDDTWAPTAQAGHTTGRRLPGKV